MHLKLSKAQLSDFGLLSRLNPQSVRDAAEALDCAEMKSIPTADALIEICAAHFEDAGLAKTLIGQAVGLQALMRHSGCGVDDVIEALSLVFSKEDEFPVLEWGKLKESFALLLSAKQVRVTAKAVQLQFDYMNLFKHARVVSDIRPLFSADATTIEGSVISFTLRLQYTSDDGHHDLSIALDEEDIKSIQKSCERALQKAETSKIFMEANQIPSLISGGNK